MNKQGINGVEGARALVRQGFAFAGLEDICFKWYLSLCAECKINNQQFLLEPILSIVYTEHWLMIFDIRLNKDICLVQIIN